MKILFCIDSLKSGGKERRLSQLVRGIKQTTDIDFEIALMCDIVQYKYVFDLNINIHYLLRKSKKDPALFLKFYSLCREYKPDIVHCWDSMTAVYLVPACKLLKIRLVNGMVIDSPVRQNILNKYWFRAKVTFPFSDIIVGNSNAGIKAYHAPAYKSVCIYNGIDLTRFDNLKDPGRMKNEISAKLSDDSFIVGMVAIFAERKDYTTLIKTAIKCIAINSKIRFILVGDGPDFEKIKNMVPSSMSDEIIFLGRRFDVESIENIFDAGVLLTNARVHGEGISNSILEYMALGKPVIATRGGGTDEVLIDKHNGFLIEPGDKVQLTEIINRLANDKILCEELGRNGKQMIKEKFDNQIMTGEYIKLYNELIIKGK